MEKKGFVSLWVGNVQSFEELDRLLVVSYSDEGDFIPSIFAKSFEIHRYDDTVREAEYYKEASNDLNQLLEGFSYDDEIVPRFDTLVKEELPNDINAVVLLYNFGPMSRFSTN
ncbi:immunity 22 family protein [Anaerocolumna sp. AGMB13020]|uniref:immunity 22 family protein n=1 Tax=Anaerocolumna sp. AGMB13020 TaxID=3081750 RepID=UPI002953C6CD|nr:immunity 22 family protein [Anaerocolumna sp. AGMB13020]WOO38008.1 immunity 22 family protein [Anaerocolumna sp. AGMB13020]